MSEAEELARGHEEFNSKWYAKTWPPVLVLALCVAWLLISGIYSFILN